MAVCSTTHYLRISEDRMAVLLNCHVDPAGHDTLLDEIGHEWASLGLPQPPNRDDLAERLRQAAKNGPEQAAITLLEGKPPVPPKDGEIDWAGDFFSSGYVVDEDSGAANYRRHAATLSVHKDDLLARVMPPIPGVAGCDVFGKVVPATKAKPARILAGANVRHDETNDAYYAAGDGRFRWASGRLSVDPVYEIPNGVGLETGDIFHPGALRIDGDVEEGATVEADGDIEIKGVAEPAYLRAGGSLVVYGGITGADDKRIQVVNALNTKYVVKAHVETGEGITVEREICHAVLNTRGAVSIPKGRIVGGETTALGGIDVGWAGSDAGTRTILVAGMDCRLAEEVRGREQEIARLEKNIAKIRQAIAPLMTHEKTLSAKQREAVTELMGNVSNMETRIQELNAEIDALRAESRERAKPEIAIRRVLFAEVILGIGPERLHVQEVIQGPLRAVIGKDRKIELHHDRSG